MLKRFYVDLSPLSPHSTGVGIYSLALGQHLEREFDCQVIAPPQLCRHFQRPLEVPSPLTVRGIPLTRNLRSASWNRVVFGPETLVYAPHLRGFYFHQRQIVTVHDLIHHFHRTRNFVENAYNNMLLPRVLKSIRGVFTVSETAKNDLCKFYGLPREKVMVVPNGIDLAQWRPGLFRGAAGEKYLLTVSANRRYKNTIELLEMRRLWAHQYRLKIVSSKARYGHLLRQRVQAYGLEQRVDFLDDLDQRDLIELYRNCVALVSASTMEGFGRPALEAMAVGRPVILSDIPVHLETFAPSAIFITPGRADTWQAAFAALDDTSQLQQRIERGLLIAHRFSWQRTGERLVEMLLRLEPELQGLRRL